VREEKKRGPERWSSHLGAAFGNYHPPAVALLVNDALRWVVDRLVQVNGSGTYIERCRTDTRRGSRRKSSIAEQPFFLSFYGRSPSGLTFVAALTCLHRPASAQTSCSTCPRYQRRDEIIGITRFTTTNRRDASRDTLRTRSSARAIWEKERKREQEIQQKAGPQLWMLHTGYVALAAAVAVRPSRCWTDGCGWRYTAPMVPHWTIAGGP